MPGMCLPLESAGMGFDYRLSMGMPDLWIKLIKETKMEHWDVWRIWLELTGGRPGEKSIAYCESHDQALVGDKTIIFRLADAEMYTGMERDYHSPVIDTATDMHKLIRFITLALGNGGYLNFMGNEFGHPEWIDFPREGNGWSFHYCRRQWSLKENDCLKYQWLNDFDEDMIHLTKETDMFASRMGDLRLNAADKKVLVFYRHGLLFAFNFSPDQSYTDITVSLPKYADYTVALSSDDSKYGGQDLVQHITYPAHVDENFNSTVTLYLPARTAVVLREGAEKSFPKKEKTPDPKTAKKAVKN